jgi:hypothetical protein
VVTRRLRTATSSLTPAVRIDNLYLVGFKTAPPAAGQAVVWWEFDNRDGTHFISGSRWLGFGGAYADLVDNQKGGWTPSCLAVPRWP